MRDDAHTMRLALYGIFAIACLFAMFMPRGWPAAIRYATWSIGALAGATYMWLSHRETRREVVAAQAWQRRYDDLADHHDVPDDGHLYECFDSAQWGRVFEELEGMPPGQRSLRKAIMAVDPSFLE
jgi:hypothetical protein